VSSGLAFENVYLAHVDALAIQHRTATHCNISGQNGCVRSQSSIALQHAATYLDKADALARDSASYCNTLQYTLPKWMRSLAIQGCCRNLDWL